MSTGRAPRDAGREVGPRKPARRIGRWARRLGLIVVGVLLYAVCADVFGGYARWHTETLSWVAVVLIAMTAAAIWLRDERRDDAGTNERASDGHDVGDA